MGALEGKVAVIAGGTSGIGARAAGLFVSEGAAVVVGGRREREGKALVMKLGERARFVPADVTVESSVENLIGDAVTQFGRLDVVINNAGIGGNPPGGLERIDLERFWAILAVHVGGVLAGMKYAARVMLGQGSGSIVNTASTGGRLGGWTGTDYSAAKAAVIQLTRSAAIELGEHGIRVNSVSPGPVPTGIFGKAAGMDPAAADRTAIRLEPAFLAALESYQPIRRAGTPGEVIASQTVFGDGLARMARVITLSEGLHAAGGIVTLLRAREDRLKDKHLLEVADCLASVGALAIATQLWLELLTSLPAPIVESFASCSSLVQSGQRTLAITTLRDKLNDGDLPAADRARLGALLSWAELRNLQERTHGLATIFSDKSPTLMRQGPRDQ